ncbi:hypothetical protein PG984_010320 [Apiospora sp. TS-2023a]
MSWMDSWSRPAKSQATPAPYYLLPGGEATPYCHACGRVIGQRKQVQSQLNQHDKSNGADGAEKGTGTGVKYCSARCRGRKVGKLDREIEGVFVRFLLGKEMVGKHKDDEPAATAEAAEEEADVKDFGWSEDKPKKSTKGAKHHHQHKNNKKTKGDARILVSCSMVEDEMFAHHRGEQGDEEDADERPGTSSSQEQDDDHNDHDHPHHQPQEPEKYPEKAEEDLVPYNDPDLYSDALHPPSHQDQEDEIDGDVLARLSIRSGTRIRPAQSVSQVNGSVGGEKGRAERTEETEESLQKRIAGQRRAREREMVRCAARRGVAFGFVIPDEDLDHDHDHDQGGSKARKGGGKKHAKKTTGSGKHDGDGEGDSKGGDDTKNRKFCEAVMSGKVVEPSFAKGNWSIRWREE